MARPRSPKGRAREALVRLTEEYPDARCELDHRNPYELLAATILSAQCTDARVNMVTPTLFGRYPTPEDLAVARPDDVEDIVRSTGFYKNKTRSLIGMASVPSLPDPRPATDQRQRRTIAHAPVADQLIESHPAEGAAGFHHRARSFRARSRSRSATISNRVGSRSATAVK